MNKLLALIVAAGCASTAAAQQQMPQVMPGDPTVQPGTVAPSPSTPITPGGVYGQPMTGTGTVNAAPTVTPGVVYGQPMMGTTYPSNMIQGQGAPFGPTTGQMYPQPYSTGMTSGQVYSQPYTTGQMYTQPYTTGMTYPTMGTMYNRPYTSYGTSSYVPAYTSNGMGYGSGYSTPYSPYQYTNTNSYTNEAGGLYNSVVGTPVRAGRSVFNRVGGVFRR